MRLALLLSAALPLLAQPNPSLDHVVSEIRSAVKTDRAMETMRGVYATDRWFTFPKFEETTNYLAGRLRAAGLSRVEVLAAPADGRTQSGYWTMPMAWDVKSARLEMTEPESMVLADYQTVPASLGMWSGPTPSGGVTAEVVELKGEPSSAVKGKLVLTDRNPGEFKWLLAKYGALGAINAFTENPALEDGRQWINAWGDRGWAFTRDNTPLLCFSIAPRQARRLRELLAQARTVRVRAAVDSRYYVGRYPYVTAVLPGAGGEEVLVLGHTAEQGAQDNATGVAAMVEAVTLLGELIRTKRLPQPRRGIRILAMPELYGSMHYLTSYPDRVRRTVAAFAVDTPAASYELPGTEYTFHLNPQSARSYPDALILRIAAAHLSTLSPPRPFHSKEHTAGTDAFLGDPAIGIPTIWPYSGSGVRTHHNSEDKPESVDPRSLGDLTIVTAAYLYTIAAAGEPEARWFAEIAAEQAKRDVSAAANSEQTAYRNDRARDAVLSVLRLAPESRRAAFRASLQPLLDQFPTTAAAASRDAPADEASRIVVRRKRPGTLPLDDLPRDQWEGYPSGAWGRVPIAALYWCDGRRNLAEVARLTKMELGPVKFDFVGYFRFLERHGYVEFAK